MRRAQWGPAGLQASRRSDLVNVRPPPYKPQDVLTGFLTDKGEAPVGVRLDKQGALLVADDVGNTIWRVTPAAKSAAR